MEIKPNWTYQSDIQIPYENALAICKRWSKRLQAKTGKRVFYSVRPYELNVWHAGIDTKTHNKAVNSLARSINRMMGFAPVLPLRLR